MNTNKRYAMQETGFTQVDNKIFDAQPFLTPIAFGVLMRMVRMIVGYGNDDTALSNTFLQKMCNMSKNTVSKAVGELVEFGFLNQDAQQRKTAIYTLNYENIAAFDAKKHGQNLAYQNLASQNMTIRFPKYDPVVSQNMGSIKENINKTSLNKTIETDEVKKPEAKKQSPAKQERELLVNSLFDKWIELSGQRIKPSKKRLSHINARLDDDFTEQQIIDAMTYVATDIWHVANGQNLIEIAIRSTEQLEKKLIKVASQQAQTQQSPASRTRSTPDPLAVNAKYNVPTEMTDEEKRAWFEGGTDSTMPSDTASDNSHDYYYG